MRKWLAVFAAISLLLTSAAAMAEEETPCDQLGKEHIPAADLGEGPEIITCVNCKEDMSAYDIFCYVCGVRIEEFTPPEHKWVTEDLEPATCTEDGYRGETYCEVCGQTDEEAEAGVIPALGHDIVIDKAAVPATCTETGLTEAHHCSRCNEVTTTQAEVPALDHDIVVDADGVPATCIETGLT